MIEIPESQVLAGQLNRVLKGKTVMAVEAWKSPHKLAFIFKDPAAYGRLLKGKPFENAEGFGSWVQLNLGDAILAVSEGTSLLYTGDENTLPKKHQLLLKFNDGAFLCAYVKMYGAIVGAVTGEYDNQYYRIAREKPDVLSRAFDAEYFASLIGAEPVQKLSLKAFLATEQRIPGLGNGVLQDILFNSRLNPRNKVADAGPRQRKILCQQIKDTLKSMADQGGRDTEKDLFNQPGGYRSLMSRNTVNKPCPVCRTPIRKENYMGGSIYFCPTCQPANKPVS